MNEEKASNSLSNQVLCILLNLFRLELSYYHFVLHVLFRLSWAITVNCCILFMYFLNLKELRLFLLLFHILLDLALIFTRNMHLHLKRSVLTLVDGNK